jgi:hypothetical protein
MIEQQAPAENSDQEDEERGDEDAVADHQRRDGEVERPQDDRGRTGRLQQPDDELAVRVNEREIVEIVVIEAELTDDGHQNDLPEIAGQLSSLKACGQRHRSEDQQQLAGEDGEAAGGDVAIEELHDRGPRRRRKPAPE